MIKFAFFLMLLCGGFSLAQTPEPAPVPVPSPPAGGEQEPTPAPDGGETKAPELPAKIADDPAAKARLLAAARLQRPSEDAPPVSSFDAAYSLSAYVDDQGQPVSGPRTVAVCFAARRTAEFLQCRREVSEGGVRTLYVRETADRHWLASRESVRHLEAAPELKKELDRFQDEVRLIDRWMGLLDLRGFLARADGIRFVQRGVPHRLDPRRPRTVSIDEIELRIAPLAGDPGFRLHLLVGSEEPELYGARFFSRKAADGLENRFEIHLRFPERSESGWRVWLQWEVQENGRVQVEASQSLERQGEIRINSEIKMSTFRKPRPLS